MPSSGNLIGPNGRLYADQTPTPDEQTFRQSNTSAAYFNSPYYLAHQKQLQPIPPRNSNATLQLQDFVGPAIMAAIQAAGQISFHAAGDTGAAKVNRSQTALTAIEHEAHVADAMAQEVQTLGVAGPAFCFNLGDVIYNFGEAQYYYDQFYEPFRGYDRPIFAIPGNHDGMVFGPTSTAPQNVSLGAFRANFCAPAPGPSPDAPGIMRSVMTQPGVYFTLDAPFVSVIGLYSNVLEGPGVISSQGGVYPVVSTVQTDFLKAELARLKPQRQANQRAIVLAVHHPPLSVDAAHGGSTGLQADIDACCSAAGVWPDMVLSGHAHLYQRFTRTTASGQQVPYIVAGSGGFSATPPFVKSPPAGTTIGQDKLEVSPIIEFGYVTITASGQTLTAAFKTSTAQGIAVRDTVSVSLVTRTLVAPPRVGGTTKKAASARGKVHRRERRDRRRRRSPVGRHALQRPPGSGRGNRRSRDFQRRPPRRRAKGARRPARGSMRFRHC
jgi:hypothetical protein